MDTTYPSNYISDAMLISFYFKHKRILLLHLIRRQGFNLLKITKCSIQGHHFDYAFPQRWLPCKCRFKDVELFLSPCGFSLFFPLKVYLKRVKHPENPRINHHK